MNEERRTNFKSYVNTMGNFYLARDSNEAHIQGALNPLPEISRRSGAIDCKQLQVMMRI